MHELERALIADSAHTTPAHILEGLTPQQVHHLVPNTPHSIYAELWHIAFWQQMTLDWVRGIETPYPISPDDPFPTQQATDNEPWPLLCERYLRTSHEAAAIVRETAHLDQSIRCTSRPGKPIRTMTIREQLESLAAHNSYHFGRIVVLRQLQQTWPPASGGFTW